jgi:hypothetical protein
MSDLKRIKRDPLKFDVFGAYSATYGQTGLHNGAAVDDFVSEARKSIDESLKNDGFLHGQRTEHMFESVAVSLGRIRMLKAEESGGWYDADNLIVPDFRIILESGEQFLVEVKNFGTDPMKPYVMSAKYFTALRRYGEWTQTQIRLAIYMARLNHWVLVPLELVQNKDGKYVLSFELAMKANTMADLGDLMVGTTPPLTLHLIADTSKPRSFKNGQAEMVIGAVKYFCAGREVTKKLERSIAWVLMMFGDWEGEDPHLEFDKNGLPSHMVFQANASEDTGQGFEFAGELSGMYSKRFAFATLKEGRVARLAAAVEPGEFRNLIPQDYKGDALPLWLMHVEPSLKVTS